MALASDLSLVASKFKPEAITEKTHMLNEGLIKIMEGGPKWYEVGAEKYRQMRWNGETPLPAPKVLDSGKDIALPSRDPGRTIPCRVFTPASGTPRGVFYHIHGGGWVLQSEHWQDGMLKFFADACNLVCVSVGYRLAPENPYPKGNEDCVDVGEWLVDNAKDEYGAKLAFMGGDSAGAHLSAVTCFKLLETRPEFKFRGMVLNFGCFDLSAFMPHAHHFDLPLVLDLDIMKHYIGAYLPNKSEADRRDPMISPFFANLSKMKLPPAIFTCGTLDPLLDDSVCMSAKWMMSGAEAVLKIYPGAPHGFVFFPPGQTEETQKALDDIKEFMDWKI